MDAPEGFIRIAEPDPALPYLSHSRISRYLFCPEQYRLYYVENLRPRLPSASLEFGSVIHVALAHLFTKGVIPADTFTERWEAIKEKPLRYAYRDSWETLLEKGKRLLELFVDKEMPKIANVKAVEQEFALDISNFDLPFVGVIDLVADVDDTETVVDFKTSSSSYQDHEIELSDQLTAYKLARPAVPRSALCVLVKTKEPRIDWYHAGRNGGRLTEYLSKARLVREDIANGRFYKRSGKWCSQCDFLPICISAQAESGK